jgi:hypothetical protein
MLDACLAPEWNRRLAEQDLGTLSEANLRYEVLLGDVVLLSSDVDLSARWGWIPLLDFVVGVIAALRRLPESRHEVFDFTESGSELRFYHDDGAVEIRANYAAGTISISYDDLLEEATRFAVRVIRELRETAPSLDRNPNFQRMIDELNIA